MTEKQAKQTNKQRTQPVYGTATGTTVAGGAAWAPASLAAPPRLATFGLGRDNSPPGSYKAATPWGVAGKEGWERVTKVEADLGLVRP
jgi:hypothetical protein